MVFRSDKWRISVVIGQARYFLLRLFQLSGSLQKRVANLWTEFAAHEGEALIANGKELQNPNNLVVAATF